MVGARSVRYETSFVHGVISGLYLLRATRSRVVVTYGGLGRSPGCDGFRVDFGSVKEIVSGARLSSRPG
jgi:hypothetical protein